MPIVGLGTFQATNEEEVFANVKTAILDFGYRHIDTASLYGNEVPIGWALKEVFETGKVKREDLFIVTKLWWEDYELDKIEHAL